MAEEQLGALNDYMTKATNAYQIEIMRLRKALSGTAKKHGSPGGKGVKHSAQRDAVSPREVSLDAGRL